MSLILDGTLGASIIQDGIVNSNKIADGSIGYVDLPSGSVLQVVNTIYTTRTSFTVGASTDTSVPGGNIVITPKSSNSKFLIQVRYIFETDSGWDVMFNIQKNGTRINTGGLNNTWSGIAMATQSYGGGNNNDSTLELLSFSTLDTSGSTAGTNITFNLVCSGNNVAHTSWVNRTFANDGAAGNENGTSEIIIWEIKG